MGKGRGEEGRKSMRRRGRGAQSRTLGGRRWRGVMVGCGRGCGVVVAGSGDRRRRRRLTTGRTAERGGERRGVMGERMDGRRAL